MTKKKIAQSYDIDDQSTDLENAIQEGEIHLGGYIADKFPEYKLSTKVSKVEKTTMCHVLYWNSGSFMPPSAEFLQKVKVL